jgi:dolichyl-phosphate-mannose-protein mannosyltransferase
VIAASYDVPVTSIADPTTNEAAEPRDRQAILRSRLVRPMPDDRLWGWLITLFVGVVAALLRMVNLGRPHRLVFDETYYAKDALSLLEFGYARGFVEGADDMIVGGDVDVFTDEPSFVVHPPAGKWIIAAGIRLFGMDSFGWRIAVAVCGVITAMLVVRAGRRLFRSSWLGGLAGLLVAVDGMAIAVSRVAILDGILAMFIVAAFACLLVDRDYARRRYADWSARVPLGIDRVGLGPMVAWRPWRLAAGVLLGLACATKWSGLFALIVFGLLTVIWEVGARKSAGAPYPWAGAFGDGLIAFVTIVGSAIVTYVASWWGWITGDNGWSRNWAADNPPSTLGGLLPDWVRSLWHYHAEINHFHSNLSSSHDYESPAWGWLLLTRPVAFDYTGLDRGEAGCQADRCSQEILALGNPVLWWGACAALLVCVWMWFVRRDWRAGAILAGITATWVPWLVYLLPWLYPDRTTFAFYAAAVMPFLALAVAYVLGLILGRKDADPLRRTIGATAVGAYVLTVIGLAWWFYPIHVNEVIPYQEWLQRMWFRSWI